MTEFALLPDFAKGIFLSFDMVTILLLESGLICLMRQEKTVWHILLRGGELFWAVMIMVNMLTVKEKSPDGQGKLPWFLLLLLLTALTVNALYFIVKDIKWLRSHVSMLSVKEATEKLPTGLCFFREDGTCILVNPVMHNLSYVLFQRSLQNGKLFWEDLTSGKYASVIEAVHKEDAPILMFPDHRVWSFERHPVDMEEHSIFRITAVDVSLSYQYQQKIEEDTERLKGINKKLREYGDKVDDTVRAEENLAARMQIHNDTGKTIVAIKGFLNDLPGITAEELLQNWKRNLSMMGGSNEIKMAAPDPMDALWHAADFLGVRMIVEGEVPTEENAEKIFFAAARECLTNSVKHARADEMRITVQKQDGIYLLSYQDNGKKLEKPLTEGGGLGNLRKLAEASGCQMRIEEPDFCLRIEIPAIVSN